MLLKIQFHLIYWPYRLSGSVMTGLGNFHIWAAHKMFELKRPPHGA